MDTKKTFAAIAVVLVALAAGFAVLGGIVLPRVSVEQPAAVETDAPAATVPAGDVTVTVTPEGSTTTVTPAAPAATPTAAPAAPASATQPAATHE